MRAAIEAAFAEACNAHASCVLVGEAGILIRGPSGAGKSRLALALIAEGAWLVADDRVDLARVGRALLARPPATLAGLLEVRGAGIGRFEHEPLARLRLVVDLAAEPPARMPEPDAGTCCIQGVPLARIMLRGHDPLAAWRVRDTLRNPSRFGPDGLALVQEA